MADEAMLYEMIGRQTVALAEARARIAELERIVAVGLEQRAEQRAAEHDPTRPARDAEADG
jgi:hypothetical protein